MQPTRRDILKRAGVVTSIGITSRATQADLRSRLPETAAAKFDDPKVKNICAAAISAAREAGASYADVRLSLTSHRFIGIVLMESQVMSAGIRVLVDGYWGFASSPIWSVDEAARLGRAAVRQAKANNIGGTREVDIARLENVQSGEWIMPVKYDPFELDVNEIVDYLGSLDIVMRRWPGVTPVAPAADFKRVDKYFASTLNQQLFQRSYLTSGNISFLYAGSVGGSAIVELDSLTPAGRGFEYIREGNIREELRKLYEEIEEDLRLPVKPVEIGRYPLLLERRTLASLLQKTLGPATELDRILGYEANSTGTSFIEDPLENLGMLEVASSQVTITSDRHKEGGAGSVKWDDEGALPRTLTLVNKGILKEVQTDRERAGWLNRNLSGKYPIFFSSGNAVSDNAQMPPNIFSGNLTITPGLEEATESSMLEEMEDGVYLKRGDVEVDFQLSSGSITGWAFEVKKGKRTALLDGAGVLFRTMDLWKTVAKVGGNSSQRTYGYSSTKTNYRANATSSVTASPVLFKEATVVDIRRRY